MNKNLFKSAMAAKGYTQQSLAREINMSESTMIRKVKNNSFTMNEANEIINILAIENPCEIFFNQKVT